MRSKQRFNQPGLRRNIMSEELKQLIDGLRDKLQVFQLLTEDELEKIMNKIRTAKEFQDMGILNRAMNLCSYELLGDVSLINKESEIYHNITADDIQRVAKATLQKTGCSLLKVKAK